MPQDVRLHTISTDRPVTKEDCLKWFRKHWALGVACPDIDQSYRNILGRRVTTLVFVDRPGGGLCSDTDSQAESFAKHVGGRVIV